MFRDTLTTPHYPEDHQVILDFGKTVRDKWILHFTNGVYHYEGAVKFVEPSYIRLNPADFENHDRDIFEIWYDSFRNLMTYNIKGSSPKCDPYSVYIGGFLVNGCELKFLVPKDQCWRYIKAYSNAFNDGYIQKMLEDVCKYSCARFNISYNKDFEKGCEISLDNEMNCDEEYDIDLHWDLEIPVINCHCDRSGCNSDGDLMECETFYDLDKDWHLDTVVLHCDCKEFGCGADLDFLECESMYKLDLEWDLNIPVLNCSCADYGCDSEILELECDKLYNADIKWKIDIPVTNCSGF